MGGLRRAINNTQGYKKKPRYSGSSAYRPDTFAKRRNLGNEGTKEEQELKAGRSQ